MALDELSPSPSAGGGGQWAPHGRLLTACLVAINVFLVLLVYFFFWRFFSRKGGSAAEASDVEDGAASSAASSPAVSPKARNRLDVDRAITALPVFVHSSGAAVDGVDGTKSSAVECAICIAEFGDGEEGRLLPRCGHRFHARCVDTWFQFHTTCPLCRATILAADQPNKSQLADTDTDMDCPV